MATRVLILGGTSYVAQFLCARFLDGSLDGATAFACTVRSADAQSLPLGLELATTEASSPTQRVVRVFTGVSLLELDTVRAAVDAFSPTVVVNCIALSSPAACERDPAMAFALNHPSELIAYLSGREKPPHYFHFSTDFVYDGRVVPPLGYRETDAAVSTAHCVYSTTKLAFDEHLLTLSPTAPHLRVTVLRIANVVGGPAPLFPSQPPKFAQWLFTELLLASPDKLHTPVRLWKDEVRSFLFVEDLVRVLWRLVRTPSDELQATARVLNIGGVDAMSRVEFAHRLVREYQSLYPAATNTCRPIERAERASVDLGYQSPLDARMDSIALHSLLPDWAFSTTNEIMRELCRFLHSLQK